MSRDEHNTRIELIDPALKSAQWSIAPQSCIIEEYHICPGRISDSDGHKKRYRADYLLRYRGQNMAIIEAKAEGAMATEGLRQAKKYAHRLELPWVYSTNGQAIYQVNMRTGQQGPIKRYPTPEQLWERTYAQQSELLTRLLTIPPKLIGDQELRFYQELAINKALEALANGKKRMLLTLATGTGKTLIAFQIVWKLFEARWNLHGGQQRPRILFLADRNFLADQALNVFDPFPQDALCRIRPADFNPGVPTNASIFFAIFQTLMGQEGETEEQAPREGTYYQRYPADFFDLIIIDECHRGAANDESRWRALLEYFAPAVQLGLTATPRRDVNADTYRYFGTPLYSYSLKEGIEDGYLTPFKLKSITNDFTAYQYHKGDIIREGKVDRNRTYNIEDFNQKIFIKEREESRLELLLESIHPNEKTIIFCKTQKHALVVRDFINEMIERGNKDYCVRVTADDGEEGEQFLRIFRDNEKIIPTILTTSHKLSTGVDAPNIRNIVLMRRLQSMIEFKQIIGRGTRIHEGKQYFTIYDFEQCATLFNDPKWDGEPLEEGKLSSPAISAEPTTNATSPPEEPERTLPAIVHLGNRDIAINNRVKSSFWNREGKLVSAPEFLQQLYGELPQFFTDEQELRRLWSDPATRKTLLATMGEAGYDVSVLTDIQRLLDAQKSDIFDVLEYIRFNIQFISRAKRVQLARDRILQDINEQQREFILFVLSNYEQSGVEELAEERLPDLIKIKYGTTYDAQEQLGVMEKIRELFCGFQKTLYQFPP